MRTVFADTAYWIAITSRTDRHHQQARALRQSLPPVQLVTTDAVLLEFLAFFAGGGALIRRVAAQTVRGLANLPNVELLPLTRSLFLDGLALYEARLDKEYSLADCISMQIMRQRGLTEALTSDHHFAQEGFVVLIR